MAAGLTVVQSGVEKTAVMPPKVVVGGAKKTVTAVHVVQGGAKKLVWPTTVTPSITFSQVANWFSTTTPKTVTTLSWSAGDWIVVVMASENSTTTISAPTNANLTFNAITSQTGIGCNVYAYGARAASTQSSQTISVSRAAGSGQFGFAVYVLSGYALNGIAAANQVEAAFSRTVQASSTVIYFAADFNATTANETPVTGSGTATERIDIGNSSNYAVFCADWAGTSAGTFNFGMNTYSGWDVSHLILEVTDSTWVYNSAAVAASADPTSVTWGYTAQAGDLLYFVAHGSSTQVVPGGWTEILNPPVGDCEMSVMRMTATGGETGITVDHNAARPMAWAFWAFPSGSTQSGSGMGERPTTNTYSALTSGLTGSAMTALFVRSRPVGLSQAGGSSVWSGPAELFDVNLAGTASLEGAYLTGAASQDTTSTSITPTITESGTFSGLQRYNCAWAVDTP